MAPLCLWISFQGKIFKEKGWILTLACILHKEGAFYACNKHKIPPLLLRIRVAQEPSPPRPCHLCMFNKAPQTRGDQNTLGNMPSKNTKHVFKESNHTLKVKVEEARKYINDKYELIKSKSQNSFSFSSV